MPERPTWFLLTRDVTGSVKIEGTPVVMGSMILDADTGLALGVAMAATGPEARELAILQALATPTPPALPGPPAEVFCAPGDAPAVVSELRDLLGVPLILKEGVSLEAEDVFDSLIGDMCGRVQPGTPPAPGDWAQLVAAAHAYRLAEPWLDRGDDRPLDLMVRTDVSVRWVAVVVGQERFQRGFILYLGTDLPASARRRHPEPEAESTVAPGTLILYLDPPAENPPEFAAKARRYGWPADDELSPAWVAGAPDGGPADLDQAAVHTLTVALTAVLAHDDNGEPPEDGPTAGEVSLPGGVCARYRISEMA